uniref:asparagine synthase (glutamine-hydrolyzing) n=1 Tax=viral metagenome TaxID=1070528 RepID=A0A6C0C4M7_9ZZZZ
MCGIYSFLNHKRQGLDLKNIRNGFLKGNLRGPEETTEKIMEDYDLYIGFHRLAINGFEDPNSSQPLESNNIVLICNGEIYNHKQIYNSMNITPQGDSDCEVIIHAYLKYGIKQTLQILDGVFAFMLFDFKNKNDPKMYVARDTYGIRPLFFTRIRYIGKNEKKEVHWRGYDLTPYDTQHTWLDSYGFASEMKQLIDINTPLDCDVYKINQYQPGTYSTFTWNKKNNLWSLSTFQQTFSLPNASINYNITSEETACLTIYNSLKNAVEKRVCNTDREICCLLSGGLDSSLIAGLVSKIYRRDYNKKIHTWSIGFEGSEDLKYAKLVAQHIDSEHHSIVVSENDFLKAIEFVIYTIESYDTTSVRASVGNWMIAEYIKKNSDAKVVFNGDGSDEVTGGYLYMGLAPDEISFDQECRKLLSNIHFFDVLRSDRSISSNGLEARTPFLDRSFVQTYLSIPPDFRFHAKNSVCEKYLLRKAFENENLLPREVLYRTKEAFSDGVSKHTRSWHTIIKEYCKKLFTLPKEISEEKYVEKHCKLLKISEHNRPKTLEQLHYRMVFNKYFKGQETNIPHFWMPNFVDATDSSARTLNIYKKSMFTNTPNKEIY